MSKNLLHTPEGVRDIYGREFAKKLSIEKTILGQMKSYGFEEIQTPTFEFFDVFSREVGTTPSRDLYKFFDKEGNTLVLRPDFTPSVARCAAKYFCDETAPIRFAYSGNTFVNTSNLQGKLKEVTQMGVELINDSSVEADAEMISLCVNCLKEVGLRDFRISIGEVGFFKGLCEEAGLDEDTEYELRLSISDKNTFRAAEILEEAAVSASYKASIMSIADLFGAINTLEDAKKLVTNERSLNAIARLEKLSELLKLYQVNQYVSFDLSMVSKLNYYTGMILKAYTFGLGTAVVSGGRYDKLLCHFGKDASAIGFVIVIDDLLESLARQRVDIALEEKPLVISYKKSDEADYKNKVAQVLELRRSGKAVILMAEE